MNPPSTPHYAVLLALVLGVGCGESKEEKATAEAKAAAEAEESAKVIEAEIRSVAEKLTGELTKADLEKVTVLDLVGNQLTDVKGLVNLTQLKELWLYDNPDLTKAQIFELQKALPKCRIFHDFE